MIIKILIISLHYFALYIYLFYVQIITFYEYGIFCVALLWYPIANNWVHIKSVIPFDLTLDLLQKSYSKM